MHNSPNEYHDMDTIAQALGIRSNSIKSTFYEQYRYVFADAKPGGRHKGLSGAWPDDEPFDLEPPFPEWAEDTLYRALPHLKPKEMEEEKKIKAEYFLSGCKVFAGTGEVRNFIKASQVFNSRDKETQKPYYNYYNQFQTAIVILRAARSSHFEAALSRLVDGEIDPNLLKQLVDIYQEERFKK